MAGITAFLQWNGQVFQQVLRLSLSGALLAGVLLLLKKAAGRRLSPRWHYLLWLLLIIKLLVPAAIPSGWSLENFYPQWTNGIGNLLEVGGSRQEADLPPFPEGQDTDRDLLPDTGWGTGNWLPAQTGAEQETAKIEVISSGEALKNPLDLTGRQGAGLLWSLGVVSIWGYYCFAYRRIYREIKQGAVPISQELEALFAECMQEVPVRQPIRFICAAGFQQPFVIGLFKPLLVLPHQIRAGLAEAEQRHILRHELMHLRWGDHGIRALMLLVQALHWFNPFVWLALREMAKDCELACDADVVKEYTPQGRQAYARTLVEMAALQQREPLNVLYFGEKGFKDRVLKVLQYKRYTLLAGLGGLILVLLAGAVFLTGAKTGGAKLEAGSGEIVGQPAEEAGLESGESDGLDQALEQEVEGLLQAILAEAPVPSVSSNPYEYIDGSERMEALVNLGAPALQYLGGRFKRVNADGLEEYIMAVASARILGVYDEGRGLGTTSGREWFYKYLTWVTPTEGLMETDADSALFAQVEKGQEMVLPREVDRQNLKAVLSYYLQTLLRDRWIKGEKGLEAHKIYRIDQEEEVLTVYLEAAFTWYGFVDGSFTPISGMSLTVREGQEETGAMPLVITLRQTPEGYQVVGYQESWEIKQPVAALKEMLPAEILAQMLDEAPQTSRMLGEAIRHQAQAYLEEIGRSDAPIGQQMARQTGYDSGEERRAIQLVNAVQPAFPDWEGSLERLYRTGGPPPGVLLRARLETSVTPLPEENGYEVALTKEWGLLREGEPVVSYWRYKVTGEKMELLEWQDQDGAAAIIK